jgi:uncharacterized protein (TIGR03435 family)
MRASTASYSTGNKRAADGVTFQRGAFEGLARATMTAHIATRRLPRSILYCALLIMAAGADCRCTSAQAAPVATPQETNTSARLPSFEVASIKPHLSDNQPGVRVMMGGPDVSHFRASNVTVKMLIATAYQVKEFQIAGGPGWINSERFDIDAKVEDSVAAQLQKLPREQQQAQTALMLRSLLADRLKLQISRASKEGSVLALVVAKGGPKLKEVPPPDPGAAPGPPPAMPAPGTVPTPAPGQSFMMMMNGLATLAANAQKMTNLVNQLSVMLQRPVIDQTGLMGTYQYTLQFTPPNMMGPASADAASSQDSNTASIFTALEEQLGLKLESTKAPIDTITVDHIEEPSEN